MSHYLLKHFNLHFQLLCLYFYHTVLPTSPNFVQLKNEITSYECGGVQITCVALRIETRALHMLVYGQIYYH